MHSAWHEAWWVICCQVWTQLMNRFLPADQGFKVVTSPTQSFTDLTQHSNAFNSQTSTCFLPYDGHCFYYLFIYSIDYQSSSFSHICMSMVYMGYVWICMGMQVCPPVRMQKPEAAIRCLGLSFFTLVPGDRGSHWIQIGMWPGNCNYPPISAVHSAGITCADNVLPCLNF